MVTVGFEFLPAAKPVVQLSVMQQRRAPLLRGRVSLSYNGKFDRHHQFLFRTNIQMINEQLFLFTLKCLVYIPTLHTEYVLPLSTFDASLFAGLYALSFP